LLHALPFAIAAAAVFEPASEQHLVAVGEQYLGAPLDALESYRDRAGLHLAAMDALGRISVTAGAARLRPAPPLPAVLRHADARRMVWRDLNRDESGSLVIWPLWWRDSVPRSAQAWVLHGESGAESWQPGAPPAYDTMWNHASMVNDLGEALTTIVDDQPKPATVLRSPSGRPVTRIDGLAVLWRDLDGQPGDEVVTVAPGREALAECIVRGFRLRGYRAEPIWQHSFRIADCVLRATGGDGYSSPLFHAGDWDGDGTPTLVVGEPARGRVTYWEWQEPDEVPNAATRPIRRASVWPLARKSAGERG